MGHRLVRPVGCRTGKTLAKNIAPLLTAGDEALMSQDSSTMSLIRAYKAMRAGNR